MEVFSFDHKGRTIHLIDTPGFDDTYMEEWDVLKEIAYWLAASYQQKIILSGLIYLHPIKEERLTGASRKNMRMFEELCGGSSMDSVVLATTMWGACSGNEDLKRTFTSRHEDLKSNQNFWGPMADQGSSVFEHQDTRESALKIMEHILQKQQRPVLQIQREMVESNLDLDETSAGQEVKRELIEQKKRFEARYQQAQEDMRKAIDEGNERAAQEAAEMQEEFQKKMAQVMKGSEEIKISMQRLLEQKEAERQETARALQAERQSRAELEKETGQRLKELAQKQQDASAKEKTLLQGQMQEMQDRFEKSQMDNKALVERLAAAQNPPPAYSSISVEEEESSDGSGGTLAVGATLAGIALLTPAAVLCNVM